MPLHRSNPRGLPPPSWQAQPWVHSWGKSNFARWGASRMYNLWLRQDFGNKCLIVIFGINLNKFCEFWHQLGPSGLTITRLLNGHITVLDLVFTTVIRALLTVLVSNLNLTALMSQLWKLALTSTCWNTDSVKRRMGSIAFVSYMPSRSNVWKASRFESHVNWTEHKLSTTSKYIAPTWRTNGDVGGVDWIGRLSIARVSPPVCIASDFESLVSQVKKSSVFTQIICSNLFRTCEGGCKCYSRPRYLDLFWSQKFHRPEYGLWRLWKFICQLYLLWRTTLGSARRYVSICQRLESLDSVGWNTCINLHFDSLNLEQFCKLL